VQGSEFQRADLFYDDATKAVPDENKWKVLLAETVSNVVERFVILTEEWVDRWFFSCSRSLLPI